MKVMIEIDLPEKPGNTAMIRAVTHICAEVIGILSMSPSTFLSKDFYGVEHIVTLRKVQAGRFNVTPGAIDFDSFLPGSGRWGV